MNSEHFSSNEEDEVEAIFRNHQWRDEQLAPNVDHELMRKFVRRELESATHAQISSLTSQFKSWHEANVRALTEFVDGTEENDAHR